MRQRPDNRIKEKEKSGEKKKKTHKNPIKKKTKTTKNPATTRHRLTSKGGFAIFKRTVAVT